MTKLMHKFLKIYLLQSFACFEQYLAQPQEVKLYYYRIWYRHSEFDFLRMSKISLETCRGL